MQVAHQHMPVFGKACGVVLIVETAVEVSLRVVQNIARKSAKGFMGAHPVADGAGEVRVIRPGVARIGPKQNLHLVRQALSERDRVGHAADMENDRRVIT